MKKSYTKVLAAVAAIASLFAWQGANAASLNSEEALLRAMSALNADGASARRAAGAISASRPNLVYTVDAEIDHADVPALYVFNSSDGNAFVIAGGDDRLRPVLAVSDEGAFDPDNIPPQLKWWLGEYARQAEYFLSQEASGNVAENGYTILAPDGTLLSQPALRPVPLRSAGLRKAISPMIATRWDQGSPYYNQCPTANGSRCYTGCVATAMAQVMKFHQWPVKGTGSHSYTTSTYGLSVSFDFGATTFDWANMLDTYRSTSSATSRTAVATLMKACGVSVDMDYTPDGSGTQSGYVPGALKKYFGYGDKTAYYTRGGLSRDTWDELVYGWLAAGYPILYSGYGDGGGHEFVCDGYSTDGLFHFNWGWSGTSDGYYSLEALNPDALGAGGGTGGGFNYGQDICIPVRPDQEGFAPDFDTTPAMVFTNVYTLTKNSLPRLTFDLCTGSMTEFNFTLGINIVDEDGNRVYSNNNISGSLHLQSNYIYKGVDYDLSQAVWRQMGDGTYYMNMTYTLESNGKTSAIPATLGPDCCKIVKKGTTYEAELVYSDGGDAPDPKPDPVPDPDPDLKFVSFGPSTILNGMANNLTLTVRNDGGKFEAPLLTFVGTLSGNSITCDQIISFTDNATVAPGETKTFTLDYDYEGNAGSYLVFVGTVEGTSFAVLDSDYGETTVVDNVLSLSADLSTVNAVRGTQVAIGDGSIVAHYKSAMLMTFSPTLTVADSKGKILLKKQLDQVRLDPTGDRGASYEGAAGLPGFSFSAPDKEGSYGVTYSVDGYDDAKIVFELAVGSEPDEPDVKLQDMAVYVGKQTLRAGETTEITVEPIPADATDAEFTFQSLSASVSVDGDGIVTVADHPELGEAIVRVHAKAYGMYSDLPLTIEATPVESIDAHASEYAVTAPATVTLSATVLPALATNPAVVWSTDYPDSSVDADGVLTIGENAPEGTLEATATAADGSGVAVTLEIAVTACDGIESASADGIAVSVAGDNLTVTAPAGTDCMLVDAAGRTVAAFRSTGVPATVALSRGIYILRAGKTVREIRI